jgi:hypothetical protein
MPALQGYYYSVTLILMKHCRGVPPWAPVSVQSAISKRGAHGVTMLVLTSRYREETGLRALRYFASFAFNVSLFLERIPFAQSSQRTAKLTAAGWFLKEERPYRYHLD